jgi:tetratricopeptide (TPR) repeat protein
MNIIIVTSKKRCLRRCTISLWLILCLCISKSYAIKGDDLKQVCQLSPTKCLIEVNTELQKVEEKSRVWFSLMQFKLTALFALQKSEELFLETNRWINVPDLPIPFQVTLNIYHAKYIISYGDKEEGKQFIYRAKEQLTLMNEAYPSPIRLIEVANLQMFIGELPEAYESLNTLKTKYKSSNNPHFMMELYGHLGHVARQLEYFDEALSHWHIALSWSYKYGNEQQIATVLYNLARAQQHAEKYLLAHKNHLAAITHAETALDFIRASHAKLYLVETKLALGEKKTARTLFLSLDKSHFANESLAKFNALKALL